jgi:hypothetical protein
MPIQPPECFRDQRSLLATALIINPLGALGLTNPLELLPQ